MVVLFILAVGRHLKYLMGFSTGIKPEELVRYTGGSSSFKLKNSYLEQNISEKWFRRKRNLLYAIVS